MPAPLNLVGRRFGRLVVLAQNGKTKAGARKWDCECDCGTAVSISGPSLMSGNTTSCGCYVREMKRDQMAARKSHGMSHTPEHNAWLEMRRRCEDPSRQSYKYYGAQGITVCERWQKFDNFLADMGDRPSASHSVGRLDNAKGYEPQNCRWETPSEQGLNRRNNLIVTAFGRTGPLATFVSADRYKLVWERIKSGWDAEVALTKPPRGRRKW